MAVGYAGSHTLADSWNGVSWSALRTPGPPRNFGFNAVSCVSAVACMAVGYRLAEWWNGAHWSLVPTPGIGQLSAVSCVSATACMAVGDYPKDRHGKALAESWNGTTWSVVPVPHPTAGDELDGVSCVSAAVCIAVGSAGGHTLAESWNGTSWTRTATPDVGGAQIPNQLTAVSCVSAAACMAVGYYVPGMYASGTLAEWWNGTRWTMRATPEAGNHGAYNLLTGVSCMSATACVAAGDDGGDYGTEFKPVAESWHGGNWSMLPPPREPTRASPNQLNGVSCASATACMAVGTYGNQNHIQRTLAESWNGTAWSLTPGPGLGHGQYAALDGVSCVSASDCVAVGDARLPGQHTRPLAETWNGRHWSLATTPDPAGDRWAGLDGVSCPAADGCIAVGDFATTAGTVRTLAESWNGHTWTLLPTKNQPASGNSLNAVSCASATACTAVGSTDNQQMLAESWNGTTWSLTPTPALPGIYNALTSISCVSAAACVATGIHQTRTGTGFSETILAESWNGTRWLREPTPKGRSAAPAGGRVAVACTSATACTLASSYGTGQSGTGAAIATLAEQWNGTTWTRIPTPSPTLYNVLNAVSCPPGGICTAVGSDESSNSSPDRTLIETGQP